MTATEIDPMTEVRAKLSHVVANVTEALGCFKRLRELGVAVSPPEELEQGKALAQRCINLIDAKGREPEASTQRWRLQRELGLTLLRLERLTKQSF